jgi:endonuclease G
MKYPENSPLGRLAVASVGALMILLLAGPMPQFGAVGSGAESVRQAKRGRPEQVRAASIPETPPPLRDDPTYKKNEEKYVPTEPRLTVRVAGGATTKTGEFPDCIAVCLYDDEWEATGMLVAPNVVVTAGHAYVEGDENGGITQVFVGDNVRQIDKGKVYKVKKAVRHPNYEDKAVENDLAVLILEEKVKDVTPLEIASSKAIDNSPFLRIIGFGKFNGTSETGYGRKRLVEVKIAQYSCSVGAESPMCKYGCHTRYELVAEDPTKAKDSCQGDSGGPSYVRCGNRWYLATVTSRSIKGSKKCGDGGIYVRLDRFKDWIRQTAQTHGGHWN